VEGQEAASTQVGLGVAAVSRKASLGPEVMHEEQLLLAKLQFKQ
jgi:hypothetical protein